MSQQVAAAPWVWPHSLWPWPLAIPLWPWLSAWPPPASVPAWAPAPPPVPPVPAPRLLHRGRRAAPLHPARRSWRSSLRRPHHTCFFCAGGVSCMWLRGIMFRKHMKKLLALRFLRCLVTRAVMQVLVFNIFQDVSRIWLWLHSVSAPSGKCEFR